ncbi:MAG: lipopolysaccharide transport periplasmic protein LptA [Paracoccaceae bacterium]
MRLATVAVCALLAGLVPPAIAQETTLAFSGLRGGEGKPVEITADSLTVDQEGGKATFVGHVVVIQGELKLVSDRLVAEYLTGDRSKIDHMVATGNVLLSTPAEAAEAETADYFLTNSTIELRGNVLLTQGANVMSGEKLVVDIKTGLGRMDGRVKAVLQPAEN